MANVSTKKAVLDYATVRQQRHAIDTAQRLLNEIASQLGTAQIPTNDHLMAIRNLIDDKDSQLFDKEQDLYFIVSRLD